MKEAEALQLMETSRDMTEWNDNRELIKKDEQCGGVALIQSVIDQGGMCGKVLKQNYKYKKIS